MCAPCVGGRPIEARRGPHPMKLELETVVSYPSWGLGSELKSSGKGSKHFLTAELLSHLSSPLVFLGLHSHPLYVDFINHPMLDNIIIFVP